MHSDLTDWILWVTVHRICNENGGVDGNLPIITAAVWQAHTLIVTEGDRYRRGERQITSDGTFRDGFQV